MNIDLENIIHSTTGGNAKAFGKVIGDLKETFAKKNATQNNHKEASNTGRVKLGVLANRNVVAATPVSKASHREEKELLKQSGDDFNNFIKSTTTQAPAKPSAEINYPPVEYGYVTKPTDLADDDVFLKEPAAGIVWEKDEEDHVKEISDQELDAILDFL